MPPHCLPRLVEPAAIITMRSKFARGKFQLAAVGDRAVKCCSKNAEDPRPNPPPEYLTARHFFMRMGCGAGLKCNAMQGARGNQTRRVARAPQQFPPRPPHPPRPLLFPSPSKGKNKTGMLWRESDPFPPEGAGANYLAKQQILKAPPGNAYAHLDSVKHTGEKNQKCRAVRSTRGGKNGRMRLPLQWVSQT
jgi:hypothetical protein